MNGGIMPSGYFSEYNVPAGSISISEGGNSCGYVQFNEKLNISRIERSIYEMLQIVSI